MDKQFHSFPTAFSLLITFPPPPQAGYLKEQAQIRENKIYHLSLMLHPFTAPPIHPYVVFPFIPIIIPITMQARPFLFTFAAHCGHLCYTLSNTHIFNNIDYTAVVQSLWMKNTMPCSACRIICNCGQWGRRGVALALPDFSLALASFSKFWHIQGLRVGKRLNRYN